LKISINSLNGSLIEGSANYTIKGCEVGTNFLVFGSPILFQTNPFNLSNLDAKYHSISEIIPFITGDYLIIEQKNEKVVAFAVDFFGHSRFYFSISKGGTITLSNLVDDVKTESYNYDYYQILHFLLKGYTWKGGTFLNNIKIVSPSINYLLYENGVKEETIKIPKFNNDNSLEDQVSKVLKAISETEHGKEINLMFSGGKDSTFIALLLNDLGLRFNAIYNKYTSPTFSLNAIDALLSSNVATSQGFKYTELNNNARQDIKNYVLKTIKLLPFEFHTSIAQRNIIEYALSSDSKIMLTGQNADSLYNFGFTGTYTHYKAIIKFLIGKLKREEYENFVNRYFQSDRVLKSIADNTPSRLTKLIWKKFNPDEPITLKQLLNIFTFNGTAIPTISWKRMELITSIKGRDFVYRRNEKEISKLIVEFENRNIDSLRELLLRIKLLGHCQGKDVRCITEWCREYGMKNVQIYSASPVFLKLVKLPISFKDIYQPKYLIYNFIKKRVNYDQIDKLVQKQFDNNTEVENENELFTELLNQLDNEIVKSGIHNALTIMKMSDLFDIEHIENKAEVDKVFRLQLFWLGTSLMNLTQTTN
jgi:asparagine synthetase B (glutamine-hydrolysing)